MKIILGLLAFLLLACGSSENEDRAGAAWSDFQLSVSSHSMALKLSGTLLVLVDGDKVSGTLEAEGLQIPVDGRSIPGDLGLKIYHPKGTIWGVAVPGNSLALDASGFAGKCGLTGGTGELCEGFQAQRPCLGGGCCAGDRCCRCRPVGAAVQCRCSAR